MTRLTRRGPLPIVLKSNLLEFISLSTSSNGNVDSYSVTTSEHSSLFDSQKQLKIDVIIEINKISNTRYIETRIYESVEKELI